LKKIGIAILGLGTVGGGTYEILTKNKKYIMDTQEIEVNIEAILEINNKRIEKFNIDNSIVKTDIMDIVNNDNIDLVVELIGGTTFAKDFVEEALKKGKTVVSANKEMFAKYWHELENLAKEGGGGLYFEASCVGGVPIIRTLVDSLQGDKLTSIIGIINGTTNYILTKMSDEEQSYGDVLKEAQDLGYAEADPTADVDGFDAAYKLSLLSSLAFQTKIPLKTVYREGISNIKIKDIGFGKELGYTLKLLGIGKETENGIEVRVHPTFITDSHPLASVKGSFNAVHLIGDCVGDIMLYGKGAGDLPTGSAIVSDIIYAAKKDGKHDYVRFENKNEKSKGVKIAEDFESEYYVRLEIADKLGVLSKVSKVFSENMVSITDVIQKGSDNKDSVPLILITHKTYESSIQKALDQIKNLEDVISVESLIRVEKNN
jgi:homoserine dehydrogenase